ncbi:Histone-lysine N-methyltransferase SETMAR [Araneus ventricosus]|nr:Histone-lysine N-methyltransferase SETMAR [Araneus ventricosus]
MLRKTESPAKCELRSVIRFLHAEGSNAAEIHRRMSKVYGETFISDSKVRKWCRNFDAGRTDVHDAGGQGGKPVSTDDLVQRVDQAIRGNRRFTIIGLSDLFPEISRSALYTIVSERLEYRKLCERWVPEMLSDHHKTQRMGAALTFLQRYHRDGDEFLDKIVTGDETWVHYETEGTKEQSKQWMHSHSPGRKPVKFKRTFSTKKCLATVFWDRKGVLLVEFMPRGTTITAASYSKTLQRLRREIQNKRRGMLSSGIVLLHDNARPHTAVATTILLQRFGWEVFDHPQYSPDLAPSDFHLFAHMKLWLGGQIFATDNELQTSVQNWLKIQAAAFYDEGIGKLVPRYDKCMNRNGDYVEK